MWKNRGGFFHTIENIGFTFTDEIFIKKPENLHLNAQLWREFLGSAKAVDIFPLGRGKTVGIFFLGCGKTMENYGGFFLVIEKKV